MHASGISQDIPVTGRAHFENKLAEEATWASHHQLHYVYFALDPQRGFTSTPRKLPRSKDPEPVLILLHIHLVMR